MKNLQDLFKVTVGIRLRVDDIYSFNNIYAPTPFECINRHFATSIFLQYDELRMKWEFEQVKDPERLNEYIQRMLDISILDNELCKQYTENRINNMHKWEKNMEEKSEWKK